MLYYYKKTLLNDNPFIVNDKIVLKHFAIERERKHNWVHAYSSFCTAYRCTKCGQEATFGDDMQPSKCIARYDEYKYAPQFKFPLLNSLYDSNKMEIFLQRIRKYISKYNALLESHCIFPKSTTKEYYFYHFKEYFYIGDTFIHGQYTRAIKIK